MTTSSQSKHVWKRFCAWYGADVVERKYGTQAPEDWCTAIDAIDRIRLDGILADTKSRYPTWPPSLYEFEQIAKARATADAGPGPIDVLDAYVRKHYPDACGNLGWIGNAGQVVGVHVNGVGKIFLRDIE